MVNMEDVQMSEENMLKSQIDKMEKEIKANQDQIKLLKETLGKITEERKKKEAAEKKALEEEKKNKK